MRQRGNTGLQIVICVVVIGMILFAGYPWIRKSMRKAAISRPEKIEMHDAHALESMPYYEPSAGCRVTFPKGMGKPALLAMPDTVASFGVQRDVQEGDSFAVGVMNRKPDEDFSDIVAGFGQGMVSKQKGEILAEGMGEIGGMKTYVMTYHVAMNGRDIMSRFYMVDGKDGRIYIMYGISNSADWRGGLVFDSAASTFEIGTWPVTAYVPENTQMGMATPPAPVHPTEPVKVAPPAVIPPVKTPEPAVSVEPPAENSAPLPPGGEGLTAAPPIGAEVEVYCRGTWLKAKVESKWGVDKVFVRYADGTEPVVFGRIRMPKSAPVEIVKTPEAVEVKTPEPPAAKTPEPIVVKTPEPVVVKTPEPAVVKTPEPAVVKPPETPANNWHVGQRVEVQLPGAGGWVGGVINQVDRNKVWVRRDDGKVEPIAFSRLREASK